MKPRTNLEDDPHVRFHQEILDFEDWVRVKDNTPQEDLFKKVKQVISKGFPKAKFIFFGSAGSSLNIRGSDIDMLVNDETVSFPELFNSSQKLLVQVDRFEYVERVVCTVPILKLKDKKTGLCADITFNRADGYKGVIAAILFQTQFRELRPLYFVLKVFLRERQHLD